MRCIYFNGETCFAHPPNEALAFKPDEDDKKHNCENGNEFRACPRLEAYIQFLEVSNPPK
jgi:hypothetical protein